MIFKSLLIEITLFAVVFVQPIFSQSLKIEHTFEIVGKTKLPIIPGLPATKTVEYDTISPSRLVISYISKEGIVTAKNQFLFNGKKFNLSKESEYLNTKELLKDGMQCQYQSNGIIAKEQTFRKDTLLSELTYYPDGHKYMLYSGDEKQLNGKYKIWYPNGKLSFSGNYKSNLKEGDFQSFDQSGIVKRKGTYQEGKLVSGDAVVPDVMYSNPEEPAHFINGDDAFDEYLQNKSAEIEAIKNIDKEKYINLKMGIDQTGKIIKLETISKLDPSDVEILNAIFNQFPGFKPATVENVPVQSEMHLNLICSAKGARLNKQQNSGNKTDLIKPDEMPKFPGGESKLRRYLEASVKYPKEAQMMGIEGCVYVRFIITETGDVTNAEVVKGNTYLNEDALRVVKSMPKWDPALLNGKPVKMCYTVPINFKLLDKGDPRLNK